MSFTHQPRDTLPDHEGISYVSVDTDAAEEEKHEKQYYSPPRWPTGPTTLQEGTKSTTAAVVKDCLLLIFPLLFIALAIVACRLDNKAVSSYGERVQDATKLGPTIFPIAFAAIASRAIRSIARKLVERGAKIGVLEQLLGSQSLAGTISWLTALHYMHILGVAMIGVWTLSPLGGQSALRLLSVQRNETLTNQQVGYVMLNNLTSGGGYESETRSAMAAYYSTALLDAHRSKHRPFDIWGNPKVPLLTSFTHEDGGWWSPANDDQTQYSSLIGVRLQGLCRDCNMSLPIETSYTDLICRNTGHQVPLNQSMDSISFRNSAWKPSNRSWPFFGNSDYFGRDVSTSSFLGTNYNFSNDDGTPGKVSTILYVAKGNYNSTIGASAYNCSMETMRVEAEVRCIEGSCGVTRMRPSTIDKRPRNWTLFHRSRTEMILFLGWFPFAAGYPNANNPSPTDNFIVGDAAPFNYTSLPDWREITDSNISQRLTMAFNSIQQTTHQPWSIANANTFTLLRCLDYKGLGLVIDDCANIRFTNATVSRGANIYKASKIWVTLLLASSTVLLLLGLLTVVLNFVTKVPDILGYVSTMTRDNPYINMPLGATTLDGPLRARALRDMKVRLTDVRPHEDVGYIALRSVEEDEGDLSMGQSKERLYE
ncbi:hypothetical protein FB567DRAFT_273048 [Paraphoma chrysanthemicola]|uniref:Uncharacterized protein n=1 Tax=Paraphoma chrysanthemicola TaxID=798071 RepID=A0A8K0W1W9_9PLEO|nr:hypothetical protein FB567DRAFT_273048 [Paraphoma chrysanthemicola]